MTSIFIRTIIIYIILNILLKIMGKRQIGELEVNELVSTLLISEIASIPISEPEVPILGAIIPVLFISMAEIVISTLKNKSSKIKRVVEGTGAYIIYKGRLDEDALEKNRISINELLTDMRTQGYGDINEIYYAILEQNGKISLFKKDDKISYPIIIDGERNTDAIRDSGVSLKDIKSQLKKDRVNEADVFLMTVDNDGKYSVVRRKKK